MEKTFQEISLADIQPSPMNPRKTFEGKKFDELVSSVRKVGVIEPILVRPLSEGRYEIVAGERRYRASFLIASENGGPEKHLIPAMVQELGDDEAFDLMTIENLQREDLNELEEANGFKVYLDKKGKEALPELAQRTGISPQYISRRIMVLSLPAKVLKSWEKGQIKYGHCEQLCRVNDKNAVEHYLKLLLQKEGPWAHQNQMTVRELKRLIDNKSIPLADAKFNIDSNGCNICQSNTAVQRDLFGEDIKENQCTNKECFSKWQSNWLADNWMEYGKGTKTNGFRFYEDINYDQYGAFESWSGKPGEKCRKCKHFVSLLEISGKVKYKQTCIGDRSCYNQIIGKGKKKNNPTENESGNGMPESDAPRVSWHGQHFREEFYKTRIPEVMDTLSLGDQRCLQLSLLSILKSNLDCRAAFARRWIPQYMDKEYIFSWNIQTEDIWQRIMTMTAEEIKIAHRDIAGAIIMQINTFSTGDRHRVAQLLNIDLAKEWRITREYLDKKTTKEILDMIAKFGIDKDEKALTYLFENLNKKRGRFDTCKKAELVSIFLDSGIDLAGLVPDEIIKA